MVRRGVGVRDEQARHREGGDLGDRGGPGAAHHEVGGRERLPHPRDVGQHLPAALLLGRERERRHGLVEPLGARGLDHDEPLAREQLPLQARDPLVDVGRPERAAKDEQHRLPLAHAERGAARLAARRDDAPAHGVAGELHPARGTPLALEDGAGGRHRDAHGGGVGRERLVGQARHRVLLVEHVGHAEAVAAVEQGHLHVGAEAHGNVGGALAREERADLALRAPHAHERARERPGARAVEAAHDDRDQLEAGLGDEAPLELGRLPEEAHVVAALAQLLREGERGVDVAGGSAGSDGDLEVPLGHVLPPIAWSSGPSRATCAGARPRSARGLSSSSRTSPRRAGPRTPRAAPGRRDAPRRPGGHRPRPR